jgi:hypothetical protein
VGQVSTRIFFYFVLAVVCYAIAILFGEGRLGFIVFMLAGVFAELTFWVHFWRRLAQRWHW